MHASLVATKLQIPAQPRPGVHRARLIDALEQAISHHKLLLISAPAGYGKTTLLSQWAHTSRLPVTWLSIGEDDNDLERFLRYLLASWETVQPEVRNSPLGLLLEGRSPDSEAVLTAFVNAATDAPEPIVFVLDDYHLIEDPSIHSALTFLLDHLPLTLHVVLAGRGEPSLPLARYRVYNEMVAFGVKELQFRSEEAQVFLNEIMGLDLTPDEITRLQAQLEGWIAGLQLVALTLQQRLTGADRLVVSGHHRFIADYLREDVLAPMPDELRQFMLRTSLLDRLCGPLCEAVTAEESGQEMLETLERENLFLMPLDDRREWFRYHRLFADFLREELNRRHQDEVPDLHRRAGWWYLDRDLPEQAFPHAVGGNDVDLVNQIFDRYWPIKLLGGELKVVLQWLKALPEEWQVGYPIIGFARAGTLLFTGQFEACARYLDQIEQWLASAEDADKGRHQARVTAIRCFMACRQNELERAELLADRALRDLVEADLGFRLDVYRALGDTYRKNGLWEPAQKCYRKVLEFTHAPTFRVQSAHVYGALADLSLRQGRLRDAAAYWRRALGAIQNRENWGRLLPLPLIGWVYIRLGELLYEWNHRAEAWDHISRGLQRAELGGDVRAMIAGYLIAGRLKLTEGDIEVALDYLEQARPHVESAHFSHWASRFERFQLELWLAQDRLRTAVNWGDEMLQNEVLEERPESEVARLAIARVLIVKGDMASVDRALTLLDRMLQTAEEEGRMGVTIETLALQALAHWQQGKRPEAVTSLEQALRLAEPEGYVRRLADYGLPMIRLLQEARTRRVMPDYVETLMAAYGVELPAEAAVEQALPEPLTPREQEILTLLAAGLTNREIAKKLVISPQTVKKHAGNIYGKLGVHSRTEAAAKARELCLLD